MTRLDQALVAKDTDDSSHSNFVVTADPNVVNLEPLNRLTEEKIVPEVFDISFENFLKLHPHCSTRLQNGIRAATLANSCPYNTVISYINAGPLRKDQLFKIPRLGRKTIEEFDNLVITAIEQGIPFVEPSCNQMPLSLSEERTLSPAFNISFENFLNQQPCVSTRLKNAIRDATIFDKCPFTTISEYVNEGKNRFNRLYKIPRIGRNCIIEFERLVKEAVDRNTIAPFIWESASMDLAVLQLP